MGTEADPIVGNWYEHLDKGQKFEVVAVDEDRGTIEIQHFDGDVEELDFESWYGMEVAPIEAPEDWTGPVDDVEQDDLDFTETDMEPEDWDRPYQEAKVGSVADRDRREESANDSGDEWMEEDSGEEET